MWARGRPTAEEPLLVRDGWSWVVKPEAAVLRHPNRHVERPLAAIFLKAHFTSKIMPHHTYILECSDHTLYVGYTTDLMKRLEEHNTSKRGARYTKSRRPVTLRYCETFGTASEAMKREAEIKQWTRAKKLKLLAE